MYMFVASIIQLYRNSYFVKLNIAVYIATRLKNKTSTSWLTVS